MRWLPPCVLMGVSLLASAAGADSAPRVRTKVTTTIGAAPRARRIAHDTAEISVVARLVDLGMRAPPCGHIAAVGIHRYEVLEVLSGHYEARELLLAVPCPTDAIITGAGTYRVGAVVRFDARAAGPAAPLNGSIFDAFSRDPRPRYLLRGAPILTQLP